MAWILKIGTWRRGRRLSHEGGVTSRLTKLYTFEKCDPIQPDHRFRPYHHSRQPVRCSSRLSKLGKSGTGIAAGFARPCRVNEAAVRRHDAFVARLIHQRQPFGPKMLRAAERIGEPAHRLLQRSSRVCLERTNSIRACSTLTWAMSGWRHGVRADLMAEPSHLLDLLDRQIGQVRIGRVEGAFAADVIGRQKEAGRQAELGQHVGGIEIFL